MLASMPGEFGVATLAGSWEAVYGPNDRITTHIYLPEDEDEAAECHWNIFKCDCPVPEPRCSIGLIIETEGGSMVMALSSWGMLEAVLHSMLGIVLCFLPVINTQFYFLGWLNIYQKGSLHRDISIGNTLMLLEPEDRKPFKVSDLLRRASAADVLLSTILPPSPNPFSSPDMSSLTTAFKTLPTDKNETRLELLLRDLSVGISCAGFMSDGDMSLRWPVLFTNWNKGDIRGERSVSPLVSVKYIAQVSQCCREHASSCPTRS